MLRATLLLAAFLVTASAPSMAAEPEPDNLIVYGEGFAFSVKEPDGWIGDVEKSQEFAANLILYPRGASLKSPGTPIIRVLISRKADEDTSADLAHDMEQYRAGYPGVQFKDVAISHPVYSTYPKLFFIPGRFFEYTTYLNPGSGRWQLISLAMNKQRQEATASELSAYKQIIASLLLFY